MTVGGRGAGRLEEDAGIVDNSVHPADLVHLTGEVPGLGGAGEVADDHSRGVRGEVAERRRPLAAAGVQDNVMAVTDEDPGGGAAESVGGAGDEDTGHGDQSSAGGVLVPADGARHMARKGVGYARLSSSTGMVRTPAVWRAYSAKPG